MKIRTPPFQYQLDSLQKIEWFHGRALLALEMRLGKSFVSLLYAAARLDLRPMVIVCPASVKWNWQNEIRTHTGVRSIVLEGMTPNPECFTWKESTPWIINYDILGGWMEFLKSLRPKLVILDETHYLKSSGTQRTKNAKLLCKGVEHVLALSGTPLTNRPAELWNTVNLLRPDVFKSKHLFYTEFCNLRRTPWGLDFSGAKNLGRLHKLLTDHLMIRYRMRDVLKDLPPRTDSLVMVGMDDPSEYREATHDYVGWLRDRKGKISTTQRALQISKLGALKQLVGKLKLPAVFEWLDQFLEETDEKIIVFGYYRDMVEQIHKRYEKISTMVHGGVVGRRRQERFDEFSKSRKIRILSGNVQAAGTGWPGHAACNVAFVEYPWTSGELQQAAARPEGIAQTRPVHVHYLVTQGTLEPDLLKLLEKKARILSQTLDGKKSTGDFDIYSKLSKILEDR